MEVCIAEFFSGDWQFVQLRGRPLSADYINGEDIDLLGTRHSVDLLFDAVYNWVRHRRCHARINARRKDKIELTLFSIDGCDYVKYDLWINIFQIDSGRICLRYEHILHLINEVGSIVRLPLDVEVALYLQHLQVKKKCQVSDSARGRLGNYHVALLQQDTNHDLAKVIESILSQNTIDELSGNHALNVLHLRTAIHLHSDQNRFFRRWHGKLLEACLAAPREMRLVSIMGCDGAGKTTLALSLEERMSQITRVFKGKHLYRKSFIHKAAVIFVRPLFFQSRENFDERLAPLVYLRACVGLRIKYWRQANRGLMLIDRSITDFLYLDRKTEHPGFSRFKFLAKLFGKRIPTIHCIVNFENIVKRKVEMSEAAISRYNHDMFHHFTNAVPTDYLVFNNDGTLEESVEALGLIIPQLSLKTGNIQGER